MKLKVLSLAMGIITLWEVTATGKTLHDAPIQIRLSRLGAHLRDYVVLEHGGKVIPFSLRKDAVTSVLNWLVPEKVIETKEQLSGDDVVKIAVSFLADKLPEGLRPEQSKLIGVGKYRLLEGTPGWLWIAEFQIIEDEVDMAGAGFATTLFVPVSEGGTVLLRIEQKP